MKGWSSQTEEAEGGAEPRGGAATALLRGLASMGLKMLPRMGDLRDLDNWRAPCYWAPLPRSYRWPSATACSGF